MAEDVLGGGPAHAVHDRGRTGGLDDAAALEQRAEPGVVLVDEGEVAVEGPGEPLGERAVVRFGEAVLQLVGGGPQGGLVQLLLAAGEVR